MSVDVTDKAGIVGSYASSNDYIFDFTAPVFTNISVDPVTNTPMDFTDPELTWSATDTVAIDYYEVQVCNPICGIYTTQTTPYVILASDTALNTVNFRAYDTAGNMTLGTIQFYPAVIITAPTTISNAAINDTTIRVVGPYDIIAVTATLDGLPVTLTCPDLAGVDNDIDCTVDGGVPI